MFKAYFTCDTEEGSIMFNKVGFRPKMLEIGSSPCLRPDGKIWTARAHVIINQSNLRIELKKYEL